MMKQKKVTEKTVDTLFDFFFFFLILSNICFNSTTIQRDHFTG